MNNLFDSIPAVAILYKAKEAKMLFSAKTYQAFAYDTGLEDIIKNIVNAAEKIGLAEPYYDTCFIEGNEYLVSVYNLSPAGDSFILLQEISSLKHIIEKSFLFGEMKKEIDDILEATHDDILITDGQGQILYVCQSFKEIYGVASEEVLGKTVYEMEKYGIFSPSVTACVLETGQKVTMVQSNKFQQKIVVTATPIRDESGTIRKVISFSHNITEFLKLKEQYEYLEKKVELYTAELEELRSKDINFSNVVGKSKQMREVLNLINRVADFDTNTLLLGESGVGKTLLAHLIHSLCHRKNGPLIEVNCGAIPENLLESELFGYDRGAFTGAKREGKPGLIELAQNGTLFLDEISELTLPLQVKLLKVIQDKTITRVGGTQTIKVDFRLITASNRILQDLVDQRKFREDLFYRLNVIPIFIPPLRERKDDIFHLCLYFLEKLNKKYKLNKSLASSTIDKLVNYDWPGNIRELENVIERILLTSEQDNVTVDFLPENIKNPAKSVANNEDCELPAALDRFERTLIIKAYEKHGTTVGVAKALGISQASAARKIQKYARTL